MNMDEIIMIVFGLVIGPLSADNQRIVFSHMPDCEKTVAVLSFPYACPESVLVK